MDKNSLLMQFHKDMLNIYEESKKIGYNASRFKQMVANQGGFNVAKKFILSNNPSEGFVHLWELERLDLTVEALVLKEKYQSLFTEDERATVFNRLKVYGFELLPETKSTTKEANTWIFQGNPNVFDIDGYVNNYKYIWWSLRQEHFADKIQLNDIVYLWRSDGGKRGTGGILAISKVVSLPQEKTDDENANDYWLKDDGMNSYPTIKLEVLEVRLNEGFINRLSLLEHPVLKDLLILRLRQQTNYLLLLEHAVELKKLWNLNDSKTDLDYFEGLIDDEVTETEKEQIIKSRIGQSSFKKALLRIEKKCSFCHVSDERLLIASHIKPWSESNDTERLDVNNGLLLCPNHDALFDKLLISFDVTGKVMIDESLDITTKTFLNINETMEIRMNKDQKCYMDWHREKFLRKTNVLV